MAPWLGLTATRAFFYKPSDGDGTYRFYTRTRDKPGTPEPAEDA